MLITSVSVSAYALPPTLIPLSRQQEKKRQKPN
jgi:hypothetical protein